MEAQSAVGSLSEGSSTPNRSIAVVGSGVIGLSIANELLSRSSRLDLFAPQPIEQTTSATAAAFWAPYWVGNYPKRWAAETLVSLQQLAKQRVPGVVETEFEEWLTEEGYEELEEELGRDDLDAAYWWRDYPGVDFRIESFGHPQRLNVPPHGEVVFTRRVCFKSIVARMTDYLEFLLQRVMDSGRVQLVDAWVDDLASLTGRYDVVFNCTGWGAKVLCTDDPATAQMRLLAGMVCRVKNRCVRKALLVHRGPFHQTPLYIVPRHGSDSDVICGGTAIELDATPDPRIPVEAPQPALWQEIIDRCRRFDTGLAPSDLQENLCGLRPVRASVRVEVDSHHANLIHCYGHGGSGLTLSWGSARAAIAMME